MKLLVLVASLAVAIGTVHCTSQPDAENQLSIQDRARCKTLDLCSSLGGSCIGKAKYCDGWLPEANGTVTGGNGTVTGGNGTATGGNGTVKYCRGRNCHCCILYNRPDIAKCKAQESCSSLGGRCINKEDYCNGTTNGSAKYCRGRNCQCCIPYNPPEPTCKPSPVCCHSEGFFQLAGPSSQCYKFFKYWTISWYEANELCLREGLRLAKPFDARALRSYIVERYGSQSSAWLDGRGQGANIYWQSGYQSYKAQITENSPLWLGGHPGTRYNSTYCMYLAATEMDWRGEPEQTYGADLCSTQFFALCELVMYYD